MKIIMHTAMALLCLIPELIYAKSDFKSELRDTIFITAERNVKVLFISNDITELKHVALDSVISLMINDWSQALEKGAQQDAKNNYYIISESGKRRLKSESPDFIEGDFNAEEERSEMELGLSGKSFRIYNFQEGYECRIYTDDIQLLRKYQFDNAIDIVIGNNKVKRRNYRFDIGKDDGGWMLMNQYRWNEDLFEVETLFGVGLIGKSWSPGFGTNIYLTFTNKYSIPFFRVKMGYKGFAIPGDKEYSFSGLKYLNSMDVGIQINADESRRPKWFGVSGGYFSSSDKRFFLHNKWKISAECQIEPNLYISFDIVPLGNKKSYTIASFLIPF